MSSPRRSNAPGPITRSAHITRVDNWSTPSRQKWLRQKSLGAVVGEIAFSAGWPDIAHSQVVPPM
jgi:hypothetical protein